MRSWGDVNLVLNRLVREGAITSYRSNGEEAPRTGELEIHIVPADGRDGEEARREALRDLARKGISARIEIDTH